MTDMLTNGQPGGNYWPGLEGAAPVVAPPAPQPAPVQPPIPPPPPPVPPAPPPAPPLAPAAPLTSAGAHVQPGPTGWATQPPTQPPAAEEPPVQRRQSRPKVEVEKVPADGVARTIRGRWNASARRGRWAMGAGGVLMFLLAGNVVVGRVSNQIGAGVAKPMADLSTDFKKALEQQSQPQSGVQTIIEPTSFLACPFSKDAAGLIGYDAATSFKTVDPSRAAGVAEQVKSLLAYHALTDLWMHSESATSLVVTVGGPLGVPLVNCAPGNVPAQQAGQPSATSAPPTATTVAR